MSDKPRPTLYQMYVRRRESDTLLGIACAVIAVLFIAGIITAFIRAENLSAAKQQQAHVPTKPPETTGAGGMQK
jgi:hypothetical protein